MSTRSRAKPWYRQPLRGERERLESYAVEVDRLEEAGLVFRVGAVLGAEDWGFERQPPSPASLTEFVEHFFGKSLDVWQRELLDRGRTRPLFLSPSNYAAFRRLASEAARHSTLALGNGEARFMGVPVLPTGCDHRFFTYVARRNRPPPMGYVAQANPIDATVVRVRQCNACGAQATEEEASAGGGWLVYDPAQTRHVTMPRSTLPSPRIRNFAEAVEAACSDLMVFGTARLQIVDEVAGFTPEDADRALRTLSDAAYMRGVNRGREDFSDARAYAIRELSRRPGKTELLAATIARAGGFDQHQDVVSATSVAVAPEVAHPPKPSRVPTALQHKPGRRR